MLDVEKIERIIIYILCVMNIYNYVFIQAIF
mgnify:CR=1 FL=1